MRQNKLFLALGALVVVGVAVCAAWWWPVTSSGTSAFASGSPSTPVGVAEQVAVPALAVAAASAQRPQTAQVAQTTASAALPPVLGAVGVARVAPVAVPVASRREIDALGLDRELAGTHKVSYDGRERSVLGTRQVTNESGTQTVLLVRDDSSGQIDYWQSGLRFELRPGTDYETFIRDRSALTRRFVNIEHAQVSVDAGNIAREYAALQSDPRVLTVSLLPLVMPVRAR